MPDLVFGSQLSELMRAITASMSRRQFASTIGVDRATSKRWLEDKVTNPRELRGVSSAIQLALELGIDVGMHQTFGSIYDLTVTKSYDEKRAAGPPDLSWLASSDGLPRHSRPWRGLTIKSPIGIASSPLVSDERWILLMIDLGYDFIAIKTRRRNPWPAWYAPHIALVKKIDIDFATYDPSNPPIVIVELPLNLPFGRIWDLVNTIGVPSEGSADVKIMFDRVRTARPEAIVGMSIMGDGKNPTPEDFENAVEEYIELRAPFYELNVSCPNRESAGDFTDDIELLKDICTRVHGKVHGAGSRLLLKLPFLNCVQMKGLLRAVGKYIDGVVYRNTLKVRPRQMEHDGRLFNPFPGREFAGLSGPSTFPVTLEGVRNLVDLRTKLKMDFGIIAAGGVCTPQQVLTLRREGADVVQACTAPMFDPLLGWKTAFLMPSPPPTAADGLLPAETPIEKASWMSLKSALREYEYRDRKVPDSRWIPIWNNYRTQRPDMTGVTMARMSLTRLKTEAEWTRALA
jgi:dihydroorotate dehydrogenase